MKKLISLLLILSLVLVLVPAASAAFEGTHEFPTVDCDGEGKVTLAYDATGQLYIAPADAARYSGYDYNSGRGVFTRNYTTRDPQSEGIGLYEGYFRLEEIMELLDTAVGYNGTVLVFDRSAASAYDIVKKAREIVLGDRYSADFVGWLGTGTAFAYDILSNLRFNVVTGDYGFEKYQELLAEMAIAPEDDETLLKFATNTSKTLGNMVAMQDVVNDLSDFDDVTGLFLDIEGSEDFRSFLDGYDSADKAIPGIGITDALEIYQHLASVKDAVTLYVDGVNMLVKNENSYDGLRLKRAAERVYGFYSEQIGVFNELVWQTGNKFLDEAQKTIGKAALELAGTEIKGFYIKAEKFVLEQALGISSKTGAVVDTHYLVKIQQALRDIVSDEPTDGDPLVYKYCAILYLRACQLAYQKYGDADDDLQWAADRWTELTNDEIAFFAACSDISLTEDVKNGAIVFYPPVEPDELTLQIVREQQREGRFEGDYSYLQVSGMEDKTYQAELNARLKDLLPNDEYIAEQNEVAEEQAKYDVNNAYSTYGVACEYYLLNGRYLSVIYELWAYWPGAATDNGGQICYTFDLLEKREITPAELFKDPDTALGYIAEQAYAQAVETIESSIPYEAIAGNARWEICAVTGENTVALCFSKYEVASGAMGCPRLIVTMPEEYYK